MIKFFYSTGPNPMKVALFLEESGLAYEPIAVDVGAGEQFRPAFTALNPNNKLPVIVDGDAVVFDSNAILLYLAEKTSQFLPCGGAPSRPALLSWLMFVASGVGPYAGQAVHFRHFAPEPKGYAESRYRFEARRHFAVLNDRLADRRWILGEDYTIVDMAAWGWARLTPFVLGEGALDEFAHLRRLLDAIDARPAAARALALKDRRPFTGPQTPAFRENMFRHARPR